MEDAKVLKERLEHLETELKIIRKSIEARREKKDPKAWDRLNEIRMKISKAWKSKKPSWQLVLEARR
ncbi:hypothetical protein [Candidatus Pyrohabitans sp.]